MATIRDVAKRAGVAICTVSRVLNNSGNVADETKKRIEAAMKELNYIPNELARGMFRKKSGIVAMIAPGIQHLYFSMLANYVEQELCARNFRLMFCATGDNLEREREQIQFLRSNMVDGIISGVGNLEEGVYRTFKKPLVMLDHDLPGIPFVVSDHEQGGRLMAEFFIKNKRKCIVQLIGEHRGRTALSRKRHDMFEAVLREAGIQCIPFVVSDHEQGGRLMAEFFIKNKRKCIVQLIGEHRGRTALSRKRHDMFGEVLQEAGIQCIPLILKWTELDFYNYLEMAETMLRQQPEIDGVMAADIPATAFLKVALKSGRRVPEDFNIVACDGTYLVSSNTMEITSIVQNLPEIARQSVDLLIRMIDGENPKQPENPVPVLVHQGETT